MDLTTLPCGIIGYRKVPITTVKLSHYRNIDLNTLFPSLVRKYHLEVTETNFVEYQYMKKSNSAFEVNHIDLYKDPKYRNAVYQVQLFQNLAPRKVPRLPYSKENL